MKATFRIEKPGEVECSMTITMPLVMWENLRADLSRNYPPFWLGNVIGDLVVKARAEYGAEVEATR